MHIHVMDSSWQRKAKDTFAGFVGGAVQVLVGQPFDLVKVRMQTGQYKTIAETVTQTLAKEGPAAFYKGTTAPLFGVGACVSIQFYTFHETKRQIANYTKADLTPSQFYLAGATAGVANSVVTTPIEHVRILMQTQKDSTFKGPFDAARKVSAQYGWRAVYRGFSVTTLREIQAYGTWFMTFEYLISTQTRQGIKRDDIPTWKLMSFGALAGEALWLASYPLDVVKSQFQGDKFGPAARYKGAIDAARQTWKTLGFRGFWVGLVPTLLRALPASACTFASVELTLRFLG